MSQVVAASVYPTAELIFKIFFPAGIRARAGRGATVTSKTQTKGARWRTPLPLKIINVPYESA